MSVASPQTREQGHRPSPWTRIAAGGVVAGAGFLLVRTIMLIDDGMLRTYSWWAAALLVIELLVDAAAVMAGVRWLLTRSLRHGTVALQAVAAMILMHALRVAVFVVGRTGPWIDFDIRPEHRANYATTWTWFEVWFAGSGATISLIVLAVVWRRRRHRAAASDQPSPRITS